MSRKPWSPGASKKEGDGQLLDSGGVRVSESGQFTVSMDAVRLLPSFRRDVKNVAQIREKLNGRR